ncbi:hypothetical protein TREMEDRAFT_63914 [Tremella mesenterica DSM 1558]|uniref:uncharacterized protein n=1 Tax=Tremella mesenterica (strain ATCC 24925 / CBS 8224 / DSM 1558 / NBRC 9311 / NRRL Y-6157 / RJB 2259-6 / UBC 559-6) TaxID=578456 RepID=UPI0003F49865|nr:uncharacterized protein TREMEDRAFT_63914 [Tremella mesenterica DSM 1558]EIW68028.1 hypothetical protein TREMEDRAFT_63914 [Tremella mesenterica DSM 1558]
MSLKARRQVNLSLEVPQAQPESADSMKTPNPFNPQFHISTNSKETQMVMTPDTPYIPLSPFGKQKIPWTEHQEGILQAYLHQATHAGEWAPGELPPSHILDQLCKQVVTIESLSSPTWPHDSRSTRERLFNLALIESRNSVGGHRKSDKDAIVPVTLTSTEMNVRNQRPSLTVLGIQGQARHQDSMDLLLGQNSDEEGIVIAQRLSSSLQDTTVGNGGVLHSKNGLSSPLAFTFNVNLSTLCNRRPSYPSVHSPLPRPSPLSRGPSFTSADLYSSQEDQDQDDSLNSISSMSSISSIDEESNNINLSQEIESEPELGGESDSPISEDTQFSTSPISSSIISFNSNSNVSNSNSTNSNSMQSIQDPRTPLSASFNLMKLHSTTSTPTPTPTPTLGTILSPTGENITLTITLPPSPQSNPIQTQTQTSRLSPSSPSSTTATYSPTSTRSNSVISSPNSENTITVQTPISENGLENQSNIPGAPIQPRRPIPLNLPLRPIHLARSLSDDASGEKMIKRQRTPGGLAVRGLGGDLRSPFEHKPVTFVQKMGQ